MDEVEGTQQPCSAGGSVDSDEIPNPEGNLPPSRVLLCGRLAADEECVEATAALAAEVCGAASAADAADDEAVAGLEELAAAAVGCGGGRPLHVVFDHFQGPVFEAAHRAKHRILGRTALLQLAAQGERLPNNARPLYTLAMRGAVICFTGFRKKEELTHLITLIHNMGGSIRKDMSARVTHLIAAAAGGEKYRYAVTFRVPIMSRTWVEACWEQRKEITTDATDEAIMTEHKLKVFAGARVVFIGFAEDERQHMADVLSKNGGEPTSLDDLTCTHVVMANGETYGRAHAPSRSSMDLLSPRSRTHTPTAKTNLYRRLSARLSAKKKTPERSEEDYSRFNLETMDADKYKSLTRGLDYSTETSPATDESCSEKENVDEPKKGLLRKTSTLRSAEETIPETNEDDADVLKSPHLSVLFEPEPEITLDLPTVTNSAVLSSGKKRSRNSTDSTAKQTEESDWKSPFKKLKIKDSFRFKGISKPVIFKRDKKKPRKSKSPLRSELDACLTSTPSPKKDDDADSICDRSVFTSSGIFDISFRSLRGTKSASRIRRSMKSLTASFRKRGEKPDAEISPVSSNEDCEEAATSALEATTPLRKAALDFCAQQRSKEALFKTPQSRKVATPTVSSPTLDPEAPAVAPHFPRREPTDETDSATALLPRHNRQFLSVVDEHNTTAMPDSVSPKAHIVKAEWFWASVQNEEAQEEKDYLFEDYLDSLIPVSRRSSAGSLSSAGERERERVERERERERESSPPRSPGATSSSVVTPLSAAQLQLNRLRKRKLRGGDSALNKRRSSVGDAVLLSLSGGLLDSTQSPDGKQLLDEAECGVPVDVVRKLMSPRQQVFMELLQTESNYVNILHTIVTMFKLPLEQMTEEENGNSKPLLNNTELKIIFGNLPPIYEIHRRMLEELKWSSQNWSEDISIGRLVLKYAQDMVKAYPPFVNFFENTKEMLGQCDKDKPRFHAFLKICQTKPECGRQSLQELLIRPVQRLPSISLLLDDILKHTHKSNPDHVALVSALAGVREVMTHINEDKRKTEGQLQMFDIYNEIDNCPAHLVSSHRSFIARCEVVELSKDLSGRGDHLVLFLFSDTLEVCKRRSKSFNSKSPTGANGIHHTTSRFGSNKPYRHVQLMPLSTVKMVIDIRETDECHNVFALMCRSNQELKEKLYSFTITDELVEKTHFLRQLCRQMANTVCKADADKFLTSFESHQLDIDTSDIALGTLSKAFKFASRTRLKLESMAAIPWFRSAGDATTATSPSGTSQALGPTHLLESWVLRARLVLQVGRAFSFNKTPSKLKRAVSSMISPFGSAANLTPANQLAQMRLQSCTNINELGVSGMGNSGGNNAIEKAEVLVAPLSVQPQRKAKTASLSGGALRRL